MKTRTEKVIDVNEWDELVEKTYGRPYSFQQQDGCKPRGSHRFAVPDKETCDYERDVIPEVVNGPVDGVSFAAWLARDPKAPLKDEKSDYELKEQWCIDLFWHRNFYPDFQTVANDLHTRGLLPSGKYTINIDW